MFKSSLILLKDGIGLVANRSVPDWPQMPVEPVEGLSNHPVPKR